MAYGLQLSTSPALPDIILLHFCEYTEKFSNDSFTTLRKILKECERSFPRVAVPVPVCVPAKKCTNSRLGYEFVQPILNLVLLCVLTGTGCLDCLQLL